MKTCNERQRRSLCDDTGVGSSRGYNDAKMYTVDIGAPKYIKRLLTDPKGDVDDDIVTVGDFDTPLSTVDRPSRQKINKEKLDFNQIYLRYIQNA